MDHDTNRRDGSEVESFYVPALSPSNSQCSGTSGSGLGSSQERKTHDRKRAANHIRRPPNAFLLYRSDFYKKGIIPPSLESKQQNISRVVGECWRRLDPSEREYWTSLAKQKELEHNLKYPNYQYKPVKRANVQKRRSSIPLHEEIAHCHYIRRTLLPHLDTPLPEPTVSQRRRKRRPRSKVTTTPTAPLNYIEPTAPPSVISEDPAFMEPLISTATPNLTFAINEPILQLDGATCELSTAFNYQLSFNCSTFDTAGLADISGQFGSNTNTMFPSVPVPQQPMFCGPSANVPEGEWPSSAFPTLDTAGDWEWNSIREWLDMIPHDFTF